jgi:hypothetical protein
MTAVGNAGATEAVRPNSGSCSRAGRQRDGTEAGCRDGTLAPTWPSCEGESALAVEMRSGSRVTCWATWPANRTRSYRNAFWRMLGGMKGGDSGHCPAGRQFRGSSKAWTDQTAGNNPSQNAPSTG